MTMSAMLGVPFPFGSIGRVNPQLYALGAGSLLSEGVEMEGHENHSDIRRWMQHYVNVLCINAWQVKRYIDMYSSASVIGFPTEDLLHVADIYSQAQENLFHVKGSLSCTDESCASVPALKRQIGMYLKFLDSVIELARSKWTEFNLMLMVVGLSILFLSLLLQYVAIKRVSKFCESSVSAGHQKASLGLIFAVFVIMVRAGSFLSNSYILEEGKVAIFLLGTTVILVLCYSIRNTAMVLEAILLLVLVCVLRLFMELGLSKQTANSLNLASVLGIAQDDPFWISSSLIAPIFSLLLLAFLLHRYISGNCGQRIQKFVVVGTILCYVLISLHWFLESKVFRLPVVFHYIGRFCIPQLIYTLGIAQMVSLVIGQFLRGKGTSHYPNDLTFRTISMLSALSSTIILLSGKQGSFVAVATIGAAWCVARLENLGQAAKDGTSSFFAFYSLPLIQWSLLAVALFFCTGHWCAFDGLRYGAAFVGFDEFILLRQAVLLAIDTFGFSHMLPIFSLPVLVSQRHSDGQTKQNKLSMSVQLCQVFLMYGCITTTAVAFTVLCVTIQRRHLMVWGLFAPKYVFDVVGLVLTDVLFCLASLYYIDSAEDSKN